MKIAVLGNIIDTENIYQITNVVQEKKTLFFKDKTSFEICMEAYFDILFFNDKNFRVKLEGEHFFGKQKWFHEENKFEKEKQLIQEIERLRNEVVELWSNNQRDIPNIFFKKCENI